MEKVKRPEGCRLANVAPMTITNSELAYGAYKPLLGLEEITATPVYAELQAYSDNQQDTNRKKLIAFDLSIVTRQSDPDLEALLMGQTYAAGRKYASTNDVQAPVAFAYQQTNSDGTYTNFVFYNVTFSRESIANTTTTDSVEFDRVTFVGRAIPLPTGELNLQIESDDAAAVPADLTNFFKKVLLPTDVAPEAATYFRQDREQVLQAYEKEMKALKAENAKLKIEKK